MANEKQCRLANAGQPASRNDCVYCAGETFARQSGRYSLGMELRTLFADLRALPSSLVERSTGAWTAETPTEHLSIARVCWIHWIVTEGDKLPEAVRGRLRAINVWIGPAGSVPENASFTPANPTEIVHMLEDVFGWWTRGYRGLRGANKQIVSGALAKFHYRFLRIHPFLDGNGRVARIILDQAARELLNMRIGAELVTDSKAYYDSLASADSGDLGP